MRLFTILLLSSLSLFAITPEQLKVLQTVRDIARTIPDRTGETYENTLSAICLTESSAGRDLIGDFKDNVAITKASLGVLQIQVATARYISDRVDDLSWIKGISDAQLANRLLVDVKLSAQIAAHYLSLLQKQRGRYFNIVSGYNGGMVNYPYYGRVMKNMRLIKRLVAQGVIT